MAYRENVIKELTNLPTTVYGGFYQLRITHDLRNKVIALLKEQEEQIKTRDESLEKAREEIKWLRGMLKEQDAIVRCKDCALYTDSENCPVFGMDRYDDWFCSDGRKKDD